MKLSELHNPTKGLSTIKLIKDSEGLAISIQLLKNQELSEHITKVPAILICISGNSEFQDESGFNIFLEAGDYHHIKPMLKHQLIAHKDSQLILLK